MSRGTILCPSEGIAQEKLKELDTELFWGVVKVKALNVFRMLILPGSFVVAFGAFAFALFSIRRLMTWIRLGK